MEASGGPGQELSDCARRIQQALAADSPVRSFVGKLSRRAAEGQRSAAHKREKPMIRLAVNADVQRIEVLMKSVPGFWQSSWPAEVIPNAIASANGLAFVAEDHGKIIGFVCAHDVGFRGYLSELVVSESHRRQGVASELIGHVETELIRRDCRMLISDVWRDAEPFYRRLGWSEPDVILLRKRLD